MRSFLLLYTDATAGSAAVAPASPLDAPDGDFLQWIDFSDNSRLNLSTTNILNAYFAKLVNDPAGSFLIEQLSSSPKTTGTINSLQAADFIGSYLIEENPSVPAGYDFVYPDMTWFTVIRRAAGGGGTIQDLMSDYGTGSELIKLAVGDGSNWPVHLFMRDAAAEVVEVTSGTEYIAADTDYLLVAKYDGTNKTVTLWIDGATTYSATNASYDASTTWAGGAGDQRMGMLSQYFGTNTYNGYIGCFFLTKTALSNADINAYAGWIADKWGTTWTQI